MLRWLQYTYYLLFVHNDATVTMSDVLFVASYVGNQGPRTEGLCMRNWSIAKYIEQMLHNA